jgi:NAD(P)-dependent dehydrogenase (short-subunit alcohol dehydrogenase family)
MGQRFEDGFAGRVAVVTGGGTGMGRALVEQLTAQGCDVAACDVNPANLAETAARCRAAGHPGAVLTVTADVSDEAQVLAFAEAVGAWRPQVHLLFNNAGIGGGGTIVDGDRAQWEKVFGVCWYGVYYSTLAFLPLLRAADVGHVVNTSSVNGFFASIGPGFPHSAYSAAKFAVKGFTEALITDFALNAPHLHASVVMPGHVGTEIQANSDALLGFDDPERLRARYAAAGIDAGHLSDDEMRARAERRARQFTDSAITTAAEAATIILDAVRADRWRILVGPDAVMIDEMVRADPEAAYTPEFHQRWAAGMGEMRRRVRTPSNDR